MQGPRAHKSTKNNGGNKKKKLFFSVVDLKGDDGDASWWLFFSLFWRERGGRGEPMDARNDAPHSVCGHSRRPPARTLAGEEEHRRGVRVGVRQRE